MPFREHRAHDIADDGNRSLQFSLGIDVSLSGDARQFGNGPSPLQDRHPFAGFVDVVQDGKAPRREVRCVDRVRAASIGDRSFRVKAGTALPALPQCIAPRSLPSSGTRSHGHRHPGRFRTRASEPTRVHLVPAIARFGSDTCYAALEKCESSELRGIPAIRSSVGEPASARACPSEGSVRT